MVFVPSADWTPEALRAALEAVDPEGAPITALELYSNGGELVASIEGPFPDNDAVLEAVALAAGTGETWFTAAVVSDGARIAFTSPIWVRSA